MRSSEQTNEIATALSKAQGKLKNPEKTRTAKYPTKSGGMVEYNYADLPACLDAARAALSENGIAHTVMTGFVGNSYTLFCRITHTSGQWYESEWPLPTGDPKLIGASLTYGTRYLFCGLTGMSGEEDTDSTPEDGGDYGTRKPAEDPQVKHPSEAQITRMWTIANAAAVTKEALRLYCMNEFKIDSSKNLTLRQYDQLCNLMESGRFPK